MLAVGEEPLAVVIVPRLYKGIGGQIAICGIEDEVCVIEELGLVLDELFVGEKDRCAGGVYGVVMRRSSVEALEDSV